MIVENRAAEGIFGRNVKNFLEICKAWPHQEPPEIVHDPIVSNVPVLMLSGEADPITPPWHAEALRRILTNSIDVVFPGMGHGNCTSDCARQIMGISLQARLSPAWIQPVQEMFPHPRSF